MRFGRNRRIVEAGLTHLSDSVRPSVATSTAAALDSRLKTRRGGTPHSPYHARVTSEMGGAQMQRKHGAGDAVSPFEGARECLNPGFQGGVGRPGAV